MEVINIKHIPFTSSGDERGHHKIDFGFSARSLPKESLASFTALAICVVCRSADGRPGQKRKKGLMEQGFEPGMTPAESGTPPQGAAADWTLPQRWGEYRHEDHRVWDILFARQRQLLKGRAVSAFEKAIERLDLTRPGIPKLDELNARLAAASGWTAVMVPGMVPDEIFYRHLSERRFPAGNWIRSADELDFHELPDLFHDVFGHVVMLANSDIANFMEAMGHLGLQALEVGALPRLARLYWYVVEVGLAREAGEARVFGAAILSSLGECRHALEDNGVRRSPFDLETVLRTEYSPYALQRCYFMIDSIAEVVDMISRVDLPRLYARLDELPDLDPLTSQER